MSRTMLLSALMCCSRPVKRPSLSVRLNPSSPWRRPRLLAPRSFRWGRSSGIRCTHGQPRWWARRKTAAFPEGVCCQLIHGTLFKCDSMSTVCTCFLANAKLLLAGRTTVAEEAVSSRSTDRLLILSVAHHAARWLTYWHTAHCTSWWWSQKAASLLTLSVRAGSNGRVWPVRWSPAQCSPHGHSHRPGRDADRSKAGEHWLRHSWKVQFQIPIQQYELYAQTLGL